MKRKIIKIDENKCNGCGQCIPNCPEGALRVIDGKVRLISDLFCDGLGACIGHCPLGAIKIEEREAQEYEEKIVMANIVKQGKNVIKAHLAHLKDHGESGYLSEAIEYLKENGFDLKGLVDEPKPMKCGCPGSNVVDFTGESGKDKETEKHESVSYLRQWPVQLTLVPPSAPYLNNADLLIAADCVPFAYAGFHQDFLKGKVLLVGCPKLDDADFYTEKLTEIFKNNAIKSVTCVHMEVPCCFGLVHLVKEAIKRSGKDIPLDVVNISIKGTVK